MVLRAIIGLTLFAGVVLIGLLGVEINDNMLETVREQRLQSITGELGARLQTGLSIGLELAGDPRAQALLEEALTRSPLIVQSIEVDSDRGTVLFDSDRALRGQPVPASWRDAARADPRGWRVLRREEHVLGTPLFGPAGDTAGYLVSTHLQARDTRITRAELSRVLWIAACAAALALAGSGLGQRMAASRRLAELARLAELPRLDERAQPTRLRRPAAAMMPAQEALDEAACALAEARAALARVDGEAQRLAGIEP